MQANSPSIIVPLDGSALAETAIPLALALARRSGAPLVLVHVHDDGVIVPNAPMMDSRWEDERAADMDAAMRATAERVAGGTRVPVDAVTLRGQTVLSLVQYASDHAAGLIVMTTHGRSGVNLAWFGSIAEQVIHSALTPVLVVNAGDHARSHVTEPLFRHVLVPIDREQSGREAVDRALAMGTSGQTAYTLLTVVPPVPSMPLPFDMGIVATHDQEIGDGSVGASALLERVATIARDAGGATNVEVVMHERPAPAILEASRSDVDLIVMPMHERRGLSRTLLGSVADKVMRGATVPLLLFRPSSREDKEEVPASPGPAASMAVGK